jgi:hypothetical protein
MEATTIATTIYAQLGGRRFSAMIGAKQVAMGERKVTVKFPRANGVNRLEVELDSYDTYTVKFQYEHGVKLATKAEFAQVYSEDLQQLFESVTGLYTSLGTMGR